VEEVVGRVMEVEVEQEDLEVHFQVELWLQVLFIQVEVFQ
jgi:hypothetical protein